MEKEKEKEKNNNNQSKKTHKKPKSNIKLLDNFKA
jgi:hypothetical protein